MCYTSAAKLKILFAVVLLFSLVFDLAQAADDGTEYVGSLSCGSCHQQQVKDWQVSDHYHAMQLVSAESVLGDFSGSALTFNNLTTRFYRDADKYRVNIEQSAGQIESFEIKYTFGYDPLQQYLVELDDGLIQALNIAWDSRTEAEGGQRWFDLRAAEEITPDHPFYWKNHFQNWNARCADCHSTNIVKNYDTGAHSYATTWSEINVACESCHGPASRHLALVDNNELTELDTGFGLSSLENIQWIYSEGDSVANPVGEKSDRHIDMCGACHSLRTQLASDSSSENYHNGHRIQLLSSPSYFSDGQIQEEVFVLGSFMQSKMYEQGVTCTNCHNPHSGELVATGNSLCVQCHQPAVYDLSEHHHHQADSEGAQCVNCHMPERTYMQVDNRRDHSFTIPSPALSQDLDVPNACTQCHTGRNNNWVADTMDQWNVKSTDGHWAYLSDAVQDGDILVTRPLTDLLKQQTLPALVQASLMEKLARMPSRVSAETAVQQLTNENPMVRRAGASAMQNMSSELRWQVLSPYLNDPSSSVRFEIASVLVSRYSELLPDQQAQLLPLIDEYRQMLEVSSDFPSTQIAIANLELGMRNLVAVEAAYLQALRIEPNLVPALLNLADYYRSIGEEAQGQPLLQKALTVAPESGAVNHIYGLYLVREKNYLAALEYLKTAVDAEDAEPRYAYVYAIALENSGQINQAVKALAAANDRWPNQYDLLLTQVIFMDRTGDTESIYRYISKLTAVAPNSAEVKRFLQKYTN
jgi:predicted CXXCH cytochrome family protein